MVSVLTAGRPDDGIVNFLHHDAFRRETFSAATGQGARLDGRPIAAGRIIASEAGCQVSDLGAGEVLAGQPAQGDLAGRP